jgi:hypothetical protein
MGKSTSSGKSSTKSKGSKGKSGKSSGKSSAPEIKVDTHPGSHDTKSTPNPTLNPDGTQKLGHGHPRLTGEQMSKMGADKVIQKMHKKRGKSQWGNK